MQTHARSTIASIAAVVLLAGCFQTDEGEAVTVDEGTNRGPILDAAAFLASLDLPTKPDAERCLSDLETFVALAPRRYENQFQHEDAKAWLEQQFTDAGLQVTRQDFDGSSQLPNQPPVPGQNIVAIKPGRDPDRAILFGAHYDSAVSAYGAAYDDGSGTLIVVELARAMAQYEWEHTLIFAEWDQEEAGLVGSAAHVEALVDSGLQIDLAVNFDMAGINWPAKLGGVIETPVTAAFGGAGDDEFAATWTAVVDYMGHPTVSSTVTTGNTAASSDHGSFLAADIPAVWVHGGLILSYPGYHSADTVETMILDVGGDRDALVAGFDTVLQRTFLFTFLMDATASPTTPADA